MSLLAAVPLLDANVAERIAYDHYGLSSCATLLPSERDQNFLLATESGEKLVLKVANGLEKPTLLEAQNAVMTYLAKRLPFCQKVVSTVTGKQMIAIESPSGGEHFVRLLTYIEGVPLGDLKEQSSDLLYDLGKKLGRLDRELASFDHTALHRDFHWDLANGLRVVRSHVDLVPQKMKEAVVACMSDFEATLTTRTQQLRRSIIHGDANDYNIVVDHDETGQTRVIGLIDFGDMVYSYTVGDLAVAIAYAVLGKGDPLDVASCLVTGYFQEHELNEAEIEVLFTLVKMRLCMSVCLAAHQQKQRPENAYLDISQQAIGNTLPAMVEIDPREATEAFRGACRRN